MLDKLTGPSLQQLLDSLGAPLYMMEVRPDGRFAYLCINAFLAEVLGVTTAEIQGRTPEEIFPAEQAARGNDRYARCVHSRGSVEGEEFVRLPQSERWWRVVLRPVLDEAGQVVRILVAPIDITEQKKAQSELRYQHMLLSVQQELTPDGVLVVDDEGQILSWNARFKAIWALDDEDLRQGREVALPIALSRLAEPDSFRARAAELNRDLHQAVDAQELAMKDGRTLVWYSRGLVDESGIGWGRIWFFRDVTRRKRREHELREALAMQRAILNSAGQAILTTDRDSIVTSFNPTAERLLGYHVSEVVGRVKPLTFHDPQEIEQRRLALGEELGRPATLDEVFDIRRIQEGEASVQEWHYVHKDGRRIPVELTLTALLDEHGQHSGTLALVSDISERKAYERRLRAFATTDGLTGLWNRRHFHEMAAQALARAQREQEPLSVLLLDIDHFKRINDTHGHAAGDAVLQAVASVLPCCLRASDLWCRWGGEEFAIALVNTAEEGAALVAERLRSAIETLEVVHEGKPLQVTASIGLSNWQPQEPSLEQGLARADLALYEAKHAGRNCSRAQWTEAGNRRAERSPQPSPAIGKTDGGAQQFLGCDRTREQFVEE